ncbi:hypothetical protein [Sulfuracidifex tepidarius]|uniref:Uncharacterized protein n=1 Tax=Sulfuracidifex tepidarius TaxID=1294262 RepID=A0A510DV95_9CREN|nr:hypothetical protein [Sulfuracidifex tepidarius]BBG24115.1 hypothetical protein IC006_1417 [Sulfuracidifex tepidarius]BBG26870.1 hypothetical protein IC007_1392 [Sulfuracidifex tepidarius]
MTTLLPFKSKNIITIFKELLAGPKLAKDLAAAIETESKEIYPRVKRYIIKGWITVKKLNNINVYSLSETAKKILQLQGSFEKVKEKAERLLGRKLDEDEVEVLRVLYETKGYIENSPDETIAEQIYHKAKVNNKHITLSRVEEILKDFTLHKIIFAYRLRNGQILKIRLDKSLLE